MAERSITYRFRGDIGDLRTKMSAAGSSVRDLGKQMVALDEQGAKMRQDLTAVGSAAGRMGLVAAGGLAAITKSAMDWETAWAGVQKTNDGNAQQMAALESELRGLAKTLPASHAEIAAVAEAAGQLGIQRENVAGFTRTMIGLGETTSMAAEEAATSIARFMNVMQTSQADVDRVGSSVVALGNNFETTESEIVTLSQRMAAAGAIAGLSESDVLGFAAALSSVGVEAEAGGTAMSKVFTTMRDAVLDGGKNLDTFAKTAGMTAQEFAAQWEGSPAQAVNSFIQGLGGLSAAGESTSGVFKALGLTDQRLMRALLSTAQAGDTLTESLKMSGEAWAENTALTDEFAVFLGTTSSQVRTSFNNIKDAAIDMGASMLPVVESGALAISGLANAFQALPSPARSATVGVLGFTAAAGGGMWTLSKVVNTYSDLKGAMDGIKVASPGAASAIKGVGIAGGAAVVLWAVAESMDAIWKASDRAVPGVEELTSHLLDMSDAASAQKAAEGIGDIGQALETLSNPRLLTQFDGLLGKIPLAGEKIGSLSFILQEARQEVREAEGSFAALDQSLVRIAATDLDQAEATLLKYAAAFGITGAEIADLKEQLPGYQEAVTAASNEEKLAAKATVDSNAEVEGSLTSLMASTEDASARHERLMDAWRDSRKAARDVANSFKTYRDSASDTEISLSSWVKQIEDQAEALKNFRENLDTLKERNVPKWMVQELENLGEAGALRARQLANSSDEMIARYIAAQREMRAQTKLSVDAFAGKKPKLEIDDTPARAVFDYFFGQVDMVNLAAPEASLHADGRPAELTVKQVRRLIAEFARQPGETKLTALDRASAPIDAVRGNLKRLDGDTAEVTIRTVREEVVRRGFEALNSIVPKGLQVPRSADGGTVPRSGMGYADRWPYLLADGEEVISNRHGQADRWRPLLKAINDNRLADGGTAGKGRATGTTFGRHGDAGTFAPTKAGLRELERHVKGLSRELDKAKDALREERSERDKLMSAHSSLADTIRSQFNSNLWEVRDPGNVWASDRWGGGMDPLAALEGDIAGLRAYEDARRTLGKAGLSTAALEEILANAGLEGMQMMAGWSQADLKRYNALHAERAQLQASVPGAAADMIYGRAIEQAREDARQQRRLTQAANQELKAANKRLDRLEKAVKESAKETGRQLNRSSSSAKRKAGAR